MAGLHSLQQVTGLPQTAHGKLAHGGLDPSAAPWQKFTDPGQNVVPERLSLKAARGTQLTPAGNVEERPIPGVSGVESAGSKPAIVTFCLSLGTFSAASFRR